ncbi:chaperone protein DNAK, putative [Entamoeba dispar SAW760]|uniref:Chaperone protein DNAK, putative n=1 Tax=Entamoeba dispar (strain ATCC PRA-260 / SAW760) TaxID=370354 RepID=B0ECI3_ENTDS|nr:chaperone protein DNAK, putative [Entamoeba dispar SAW760]EDR27766.1 chaperone protein DNAK, putative [Entamoeba dispar SAW760]|eukprot:EDR27766.1 chaperone protein DNAK, putative [Entamoeba dispar SAW760]
MTEKVSISIGIDLGLTHSSVAYYDIVRNESILIQDEIGKEQIASCVSLSQLNNIGFAVVGNLAKYDINNKCIIYDNKRIIGRDERDVSYEDREHWPFKLKSRDDGSAYIECYNPLTQESEEFEPEEISGMILKYLYEITQARLGNHPILNVVVTVPAEFNDRQREATLLACKLAGIKNVELENEPTAAIIEYKREHPNLLKNGDRIVVIDFGGGILYVSCCKIVNDNVIIESSGGNQNLGGNDFDNVMIDIIIERIEKVIPGYYEKKIGITQKEKIIFNKKIIRLKEESERIKIELSDKTDTELNLELLLSDDYDDKYDIDPTITRKEFEEECYKRGIYEEFINKIKQVTQKKGYKRGNVQLVLLNGGTCKMPRIKDRVAKLFDIQTFADESFNSINAVAKGAAYLAYLERGDDREVVYDIVQTPIGIELEGGKFEILIKEGETLPTNIITKKYCTVYDNQTTIEFNIYKGFNEYVNLYEMEYITTLCIDGIPNRKAREQTIKFTIQINEKGVMNISGSVDGTDIKKEKHVNIDLSREDDEITKLIKHFQTFY